MKVNNLVVFMTGLALERLPPTVLLSVTILLVVAPSTARTQPKELVKDIISVCYSFITRRSRTAFKLSAWSNKCIQSQEG